MTKKVQLMTNAKEWQTVNGVEVLVDNVPQEDIDPITDSNCVEIEGHRTLEETISQDNMFTPEIVETKVHSKVGGVYHDNVVDGAYEEAILYGNTQVNLVESMTSGTKYIPHSFTSFQGNESKIGNYHNGRTNQVAPLVKGVTMVNLVSESKHSCSIASGNATRVDNIKGDTLYTLSFTFTTKNTNAGITIQSFNNGTYLEDTKSQTNLGDKVVMTFTTHAEANQINICNNKAYGGETIQLDNIMVIEGDVTDLDLPFFKGMRSVELSRPLTNLLHDGIYKTYGSTTQLSYSNGNVTVTANAIGTWQSANFHFINEDKLKPNTKYIVMWDSLTQTQTSTSSSSIVAVYDTKSGDGNINIGIANNKSECPVLRSIVFDTTGRDASGIVLRIHATLSNSETGTTTVTGLRVFEWDDSLRALDLQTIGYFSGTKYVSVRALETEGKNLYPYGDVSFTATNTNVDSWYDHKGTGYIHGDVALKSKSRFLLKQGTYTITTGAWVSATACQLIDDKEQIVVKLDSGQRNHVFTLSQDTYCTLRIKASVVNTATQIPNIQIERGETATSYEAYQGRYYKPRETEEIILRSLPNGVCDTFNLQTGELVQRIGEIVLDGDENIKMVSSVSNDTHTYFDFDSVFVGALNGGDLVCDSFAHIDYIYGSAQTVEGINIGNLYWGSIRILNSRLSSVDVDGFKTYLQQNPVTVQYELKEPIITKLQTYNRVYSGQTNALTSMGNNLSALTYYNSNYYLKVGNLSPIPAILEPITTIPYDVRLKPSTLYTVKYNRGGNSNSMSFDLGGSVVEKTNSTTLDIVPEEFTVKTPAILSHEQLILSGTGYAHNFIVVEGDITGTELPYFEGMKDVKMPIVKNVGKNLLNESSMRVFYESGITLRTYDVFACKPNTRYCFVSVGGETNCNWHVCKKDAHYERPENESVGITQYLGYSREIVTPQDCYYMCIHTGSSPTTDREVYDIKTAIYEGSFAECVNYGYEDYKENSVYVVQGEYPITSEMIEQGGFSTNMSSSDGSYETMKYGAENVNYLKRLRSKDLIPVKPNTTYAFAHSFSKFAYNVYQWNGNREFIDEASRYFADGQVETITTTADTQYIHFLMSKYETSQTITVAEYDWSQFHMYELDSTINLRSLPNGVKDELNLLTGEYIQRVGEVVFDGSDDEDWQLYNESIGGSKYFRIGMSVMKLHGDVYTLCTHAICDKLENVVYFSGIYNMSSRPDSVVAFVHSSSLNTQAMFVYQAGNQGDLAQFKQWLQSNPLTVQYELAEPIISHVRLVSNNQEREVGVKLPNGVSDTYNPSTGITTVRVGKVVLDGSENWKEDTSATKPTDLVRFAVEISDMIKGRPYNTGDLAYESNISYNIVNNDITSPRKLPNIWNYYENNIYMDFSPTAIGMTTSDTTETKLSKFKTYLASNPVTVWYELNYPQIQPDIVLPNGVHDEYNPETGVYTKRVGFVELDGNEKFNGPFTAGATVQGMYYYSYDLPVKRNTTSKQLTTISSSGMGSIPFASLWLLEQEGVSSSNSEGLGLRFATKCATASELQQYFVSNPTKVWYELATPITYKLTPYFGLPQPYAYEDGYLIHDSAYTETTLPPEFKYKLVANRTGQIVQNGRKLQEHTTRLSNLEALIIEATIESLFNRELQLFELELMDIQLIDLGE